MTDAGWAEKLIQQKVRKTGAGVTYVSASELLRQEHARAVRIVKAYLAKAMPPDNSRCVEDWEDWHRTKAICGEILTVLQRGRGGKG